MTFIDFNSRKRLQIWKGIEGPVFHSKKISIGHFTIQKGTDLPEHSHLHEQWTNVIDGKLEFNIDGDIQIMESGMTAYIPPNIPHSAKALSKCKVIDCFTPPREDFIELEKNS